MADYQSKWNPWFTAAVVTAFIAMIGFFNIDSAWADKANANTLLKIGGAALTVLACFFMYKAFKTSTGKPG